MTIPSVLLLFLCLCFFPYTSRGNANPSINEINRLHFPPDFVFGAGTSAYQVEGAAAEDERKPSVWDTYTHLKRNIEKGTGDITSDQYHKYKEDVKLMHKMGLDAYRFSISWSRLIPDGRGAVNPKGLDYYNNLLDELVSYGIQAHVTLNHFDIPQALQDEYEGFQCPKIIEDFTAYADICFKEFGDRVKTWITFNELNTGFGLTPCFSTLDPSCPVPDNKLYLGAHNSLLAHATAVRLYKAKYQKKQRGQIGMTLLAVWPEPLTNSSMDVAESNKQRAFRLGWFLDPLFYGQYPVILRETMASALPNMTEMDSKLIKGSFDYIGVNYYYGDYVSAKTQFINWLPGLHGQDSKDLNAEKYLPTGVGLQKFLEYLKHKYHNPTVFIHENGLATNGDDSSDHVAQNDTSRILYIKTHIETLLQSIRCGSNVKGYFVWSFLDCFELIGSYDSHYGLYGVDFSVKNRRRYPRMSVEWYSTFLSPGRRKAS
ncbi:beta-glucosidase [Ranunculus cassubicifolius]